MKMQYFRDTDTLFIEFNEAEVAETRDLDGDTIADMDASGKLVALTLEHAQSRTDLPNLTFEEVAA